MKDFFVLIAFKRKHIDSVLHSNVFIAKIGQTVSRTEVQTVKNLK